MRLRATGHFAIHLIKNNTINYNEEQSAGRVSYGPMQENIWAWRGAGEWCAHKFEIESADQPLTLVPECSRATDNKPRFV